MDALYLLTARGGDYLLLMQRFNAGLVVMALIALLMDVVSSRSSPCALYMN